jgi:hypothetical protein
MRSDWKVLVVMTVTLHGGFGLVNQNYVVTTIFPCACPSPR